jgi:hypothetical protein
MATKELSFKQLPNLAVAEAATSPDPGVTGAWCWSTSLGKPMYWNGSTWTSVSSGGGSGSPTYSGTALVNFGSFPGNNEASITVTGQGSILNTSKVNVFISADATSSDHTASDHRYLSTFIGISTSTPTPSTGFTIYVRSIHKLQGTYTLNWVWTD